MHDTPAYPLQVLHGNMMYAVKLPCILKWARALQRRSMAEAWGACLDRAQCNSPADESRRPRARLRAHETLGTKNIAPYIALAAHLQRYHSGSESGCRHRCWRIGRSAMQHSHPKQGPSRQFRIPESRPDSFTIRRRI
nr:hypothetical protein CFP56_43895 [Quercus suber]